MATNNDINTTTPLKIISGGTNATSFATSTGVVKYDGTSLVTSSAVKIDSSNRQVNASQPCFLVSKTGDVTNVTGNGTDYTVTFTTSIFDQASNFDGTSTFTAPVTGNYVFTVSLFFLSMTSSHTSAIIKLVTSAATYVLVDINPQGEAFASGAQLVTGGVATCNMTAADTALVHFIVSGGTKVVGIDGSTSSGYRTPFFAGYLLC